MNSALAPLLLFSTGNEDGDFLYASKMAIEEGLYVRFEGGEDWLVVPRLEIERAREEGRAAHVLDRADLGWSEKADRYGAWVQVAAALLEPRGTRSVRVSPLLPAVYYAALGAAGLEPRIDSDLLLEERRRKSPEEAGWIRDAQRAAEAACAQVIRCLFAASPGADGTLVLDSAPLTSERLAARAQAVLNERGHAAAEMIVAGSPGCAVPHFRGSGPIRSGLPVIIDIFPRGLSSRYHGDLTRTVVPGVIPSEFRRMHGACVEALEVAIGDLRDGADGRDVHRAACRTLVERGYGTTTTGYEGDPGAPRMTHSLGHGVGIDVHEAPQLRDRTYPLVAGDVVAVEPGLYRIGLGGVRVEDTGMVTEVGFQNFTTLTRSLDPRDYLES